MDKTAKERMRRYRNKKRNEKGEDVTVSVTAQYPAILHALLDPVKRKKLESICLQLRQHNILGKVRYGVFGPSFDIVEEMLRVT